MAKAFISYSRKDIEFAKRLTNELKKSELDFWVDWEGIPPTVDWWKEIEKGIEEADFFLFLISPDSATSKVCGQEIDHAVKNAKRIIPIVVRDVTNEDAPKQLSHLNYIFFRTQDDFDTSLKKLLEAIHTDYEWVQAHRRLQNKALEWERNTKDPSFLLRGVDLLDAESDLATNTSKEPHPTNLQREYVFASRKATDRQKRITTGLSIAAGIILALLAVYGLVQASLAKAEARRATAGQLALESKSAVEKYPQRALLLALESVRISQEANEPVLTEAEEALRLANERVSGYGLATFTKEPSILQFTQDGKWLLVGTQYGGEAGLWNVQRLIDDPVYEPFRISFEVDLDDDDTWNVQNGLIKFSANETWVMVNATKSGSGLWKVDVEDENRTPILFDGKIEFLFAEDETLILEKQADSVVLWQVDAVELTKKELQRIPGVFITASKNKRYILVNNPKVGIQVWDASANTANMLATLTPPDFELESAMFDAKGRWVVLVENIEHPDILIEGWTVDENTGEWSSTLVPWVSNNLVVYSLSNPNEAPVIFDLGLDLFQMTYEEIFDISPDGNKFLYSGTKPIPTNVMSTISRSGYLDLTGEVPVHTVFDVDDFEARIFIGNNFVFVTDYSADNTGTSEKYIDLRDMSEIPVTDFFYNLSDYSISKDGKYAASGDLMLDIQKLEDEHEAQIMPINRSLFELPEAVEASEFENSIRAQPLMFGLEDAISLTTTSPDGRWLVAGAMDGSVRFWDAHAPLQDTQIALPDTPGFGYPVAMSNDNQWMTLGSTLWALENGKPVRFFEYVFDGDTPFISVFSPDSRWSASIFSTFETAEKAQVVITDLQQSAQGELVQKSIKEVSGYSATLQFSTNGRWLAVINEKSFLYDLEAGTVYDLPYAPAQMVFMEERNLLVLTRDEHQNDREVISQAEVWSLPVDGVEFAPMASIKPEAASRLFLSQNGRWLAGIPLTETSQPLNLWDVGCVLDEPSCEPQTFNANGVVFSRDSKKLLLGLRQGDQLSYEVWDVSGKSPAMIFSNSTNKQGVPIMGNSGEWVLFGKDMSLVGSFLSSTWAGTTMNGTTTFDGYGTYFLGGGGGGGGGIGSFQIDYVVQALNAAEEKSINLRGHESNISLSHISPNERYALTYSGGLQDDEGASENVFRLWDLHAMQDNPKKRGIILPYILKSDADTYSSFDAPLFSPNSEWIYVLESHTTALETTTPVQTYNLHYTPTSIEVLKERACQAVGRNFIINEWERFFPDEPYRKTCENLPEHPSVIESP